MTDFTLPELGENVHSGDLVKVLVSVGDVIAKDQAVIELETEKAAVEVPTSVAGRVSKIHVKVGDKIKVGQPILSVDDAAGAVAAAKPAAAAPAGKPPATAPAAPSALKAPEPAPAPPSAPAARPAAAPAPAAPPAAEATGPTKLVAAAPSVRRMARELGVDITEVKGSGPAGRIQPEDVREHAKQIILLARAGAGPAAPGVAAKPLPDFTKWGTVDRQPMKAIRRATAVNLAYAWNTVAAVTQYDKADIGSLDHMRAEFSKKAESAGGKLTMTAIALKVVAAAMKIHPQFAASIDM